MGNKGKATQKSIFDESDKDDFIEQLNEVGRQSLEDFNVVRSELKKDVESGLLTQEDVDKITSDFLASLNKPVQVPVPELQAEEAVVFTFENNKLQIFDHVPSIIINIPLISKRYLEAKMLLSNVLPERIHIVKHAPDDVDGIEITNVFYITPYGSRINIDMNEIYNVLLKIDFD